MFLHGIPTNACLWLRTIDAIGPDIRAIAPDLTGFGLSDLPADADLSPRGQARDLLRFFDRRGIGQITLVGHDFGSLVALEMIALAPERICGMILTNTSISVGDWRGAGVNPFRLLAHAPIGEIAFAVARRWMLRVAFCPFVSEPDALDDGLLDAFWLPFDRGFSATLLRLFRSQSPDSDDERRWRDALSSYRGLVSVVWGARDPAFREDRAQEVASLAPQTRVVMLENSSHFVPIDRPRVLARIVRLQVDRMETG